MFCSTPLYLSRLLPSRFTLSRSSLTLTPVNLASNIRNALQLSITQLYASKLDHTWIQRQGLADLVLDGGVGVVTHDEVLALVVDGLVDAGALWEGEGTPVLDAADGAAVLEDDGPGCTGESEGRWLVQCKVRSGVMVACSEGWMETYSLTSAIEPGRTYFVVSLKFV